MSVRMALAVLLMTLAVGGACFGADESGVDGRPSPTAAPTTSPTPAMPEAKSTAAPGTATAGSGTAVAATASVTPRASATPTTTASASPTPAPTMIPSIVRLKYLLFDRFGSLWYCDPDFYPIARQDEQALAAERFPEIEADTGTFSIILAHLGYAPSSRYTAVQQLAIYRDWKMLRALQLDPVSGGYHFNTRFTRDQQTGVLVEGTIDSGGNVTLMSQTQAGHPNCPICLARGTRIATPEGPVAVEALRVGMIVWTAGDGGLPVAAAVIAVGSTPVPASHQVVDLVLEDGRELRASPAHPLADGRLAGVLVPGDAVDGSRVVSVARERYDGGATFDLLPAGPSGTYWADGIPLESTLVDSLATVAY